jgi:hypothetical protein
MTLPTFAVLDSVSILSPAIAAPLNKDATSLDTAALRVSHTQAVVLAQQFDQDILGDLGSAFRTFIDSGQVWALIIGFILGYMLRSVTTYR